MKNLNDSTTLRLALCDGPLTNVDLKPWAGSLAELLSKPVIGPKDGSYFVRAVGTLRKDEELEQSGSVILDGDSRIDPETGETHYGAPDPALVHAALVKRNIPHVIYSSHSNGKTEAEVQAFNAAEAKKKRPRPIDTGGAYGPDLHKWRCLIPATVAKPDLEHTVAWLIEQLRADGVMLTNVKENRAWSQPWYLPRVPDEARLGLFRFHEHDAGALWEPVPAPAPQPTVPALPALPAPQPTVPAPVASDRVPGYRNPIDVFNARFNCDYVLKKAGYEGNERTGWVRPGSTTGQPGVKVCPNRSKELGRVVVFSHCDDDLNDGKAHDAFDCARILFYDGDLAKALNWNPELTKANRLAEIASHFLPGETVTTLEDALQEIKGAIAGFGTDKAFDAGEWVNPQFVGWLATVKTNDDAAWLRVEQDLRTKCKGKTGLVTAIISAVKNHIAERKAAREAADRAERMQQQAAASAEAGFAVAVPSAAFIHFTKNGWRMNPESVVARDMVRFLQGVLAFDGEAGRWYEFVKTHWQLLNNEHGPSATVIRLANLGGGDIAGFSSTWLSGTTKLLEAASELCVPAFSQTVLPFRNGILDLNTRLLAPTQAANAQDWFVPHDYTPGAGCPNIRKWLLQTTGDADVVRFMLACARQVLLGGMSQAQMFLHLLGMGGTGKSTFMRLLEQLVGENNCDVTTMTALEGNTFETSSFLGKRLVAITDMEEWRGKVDTLKAMTGGDRIRCERKYKNKGRGFTYRGAVVILSNKNLNSTDKSSGLLRRRRTVVFDKVFTADEKVEFHLSGGEEQQLWSELPGLVNALLDMDEKEAQQLLQTPPASVQEANNEANMQNNSVAAWLVENCKPAPGEKAHLGGRVEVTVIKAEGTTFSQRTSIKVFQNADTHLYPNYLTWCQARGVFVPQTHNNFSSNIRETLHSLGYGKNAAGRKGERDAAGMFVRNIALKQEGDGCGNEFLVLPEWLK